MPTCIARKAIRATFIGITTVWIVSVPIRIAEHKENIRNQRKTRKSRSSKYKGACRSKWAAKWHAQLGKAGTRIHMGYYESELAAARAYDVAARLHFGEFAHLNGV